MSGCWQERRGGTASGRSCCQLNTALIDDEADPDAGHDEDANDDLCGAGDDHGECDDQDEHEEGVWGIHNIYEIDDMDNRVKDEGKRRDKIRQENGPKKSKPTFLPKKHCTCSHIYGKEVIREIDCLKKISFKLFDFENTLENLVGDETPQKTMHAINITKVT